MLVYIIKRLLLLPLLLFIFSVVAFILIQAPPGDFVTSYVAELAASGSSMDQLQIEALRNLYGLDQPYYVQYFKWIMRILQGDLGVSLDWQKPISELIGQRLLLTLALGLFTLLFTFAVAIPIGIISATRQYSFYDYFFTVFNYLGVATPSFMTALVLMWLAFSYFNITITGLFSPEYVDAPWSFGRVVDLGQAHLAADRDPGARRHRPARPDHARQPARRAAQALHGDGARQGHVRVAAGA